MKNVSNELINIEHKEIIPLINEENELWKNPNLCYVFCDGHINYQKLKNHRHFSGKLKDEHTVSVIYDVQYQQNFQL